MVAMEQVAARVRMWRALRIARRVSASDIAATSEVSMKTARRFLLELVATQHARRDRTPAGLIYTIVADSGDVPPPRGAANEIRQALWAAMRARGDFTLAELVSATPGAKRKYAHQYVRILDELGYVARRPAPPKTALRWDLVRDTGPHAPMPAMGWVAYDANVDRVVTREKVRRGG